jgi:hypothetical protein
MGADGSGFQSLLQAIEADDTEGRIEIHIYLTAKIEYVTLLIYHSHLHHYFALGSRNKANE